MPIRYANGQGPYGQIQKGAVDRDELAPGVAAAVPTVNGRFGDVALYGESGAEWVPRDVTSFTFFDAFGRGDRPILASKSPSGMAWQERKSAGIVNSAKIADGVLTLDRPDGNTGAYATYPQITMPAVPKTVVADVSFVGTPKNPANSSITVVCGNLANGYNTANTIPKDTGHVSITPTHIIVNHYVNQVAQANTLIAAWTVPFDFIGTPQRVTITIATDLSSIKVNKPGEAERTATRDWTGIVGTFLCWEPYFNSNEFVQPRLHVAAANV